jgi:FtsP/CotA-like multicopper oxidase with cupredoxin domain
MPLLSLHRTRSSAILGALAVLLLSCSDDSNGPSNSYTPRTRSYFVAAEEVMWNYMPLGYDSVFDQPPPTPWGDSLVYPKIRYIEYTDASFTTPKPQPAHLGILGPTIRGVVGDSILVTFRNNASVPLSMHPHGVTYKPEDEGAVYFPPRGGGDSVTPGGEYTYRWFAERESGPRAGEPSSKVWLYHSHAVMTEEEIYRGLVGTIVITSADHANPVDATPNDVDREFVTFWLVTNENTEFSPPEDEEMNLKHTINGLFFSNTPGFVMDQGEKVRWYMVALGTEVDLHTPHWHGEKVLLEGRTYTDVVELLPASMRVGDMRADNPGRWLLHCHVGDHMTAGMYTSFTINGAAAAAPARSARTNLARVNRGWMPLR